MNKIDWRIVVIGLICLSIIQIFAMHYGINGTFRTFVAIIIAGAIGVGIDKQMFIK